MYAENEYLLFHTKNQFKFCLDSPMMMVQWIPYGYIFILMVFWNLLLSDTSKDEPVTLWSHFKVFSGTDKPSIYCSSNYKIMNDVSPEKNMVSKGLK